MRRGLGLLLVLAPGLLASQGPSPHAPPERAASAPDDRQALLAELWQRRILPPELNRWSPDDIYLLERVRQAERAGAIEALRQRFGGLKGLAASYKPMGSSVPGLRLTKEGYEKWRGLRTQEALLYFQRKDISAKWAFQLRDLEGRRLFDSNGLLTEAGSDLYTRLLINLPAFWQTPAGEISGNRPPPKRPAPSAEPHAAAAPSAPPSSTPPPSGGRPAGYRPTQPAPEVQGKPVGGAPQAPVQPAVQPQGQPQQGQEQLP